MGSHPTLTIQRLGLSEIEKILHLKVLILQEINLQLSVLKDESTNCNENDTNSKADFGFTDKDLIYSIGNNRYPHAFEG